MKLAEDLKKAVLQAAMQGKLTKQLESDSSVDELLKKIADEKAQLIKEKIIPKPKVLPEIQEEEITDEIPDNWRWIRLGNLISISSGINLTSAQMKNGQIPVFGGNGITGYHNKGNINKETVVIGRVGYYCGSVHITPQIAWVTDNAFITTYPEKLINREYLVYGLKYLNLGHDSNATAQPVVSGKKIYPMLFPLPPIEEQQRIVEKLNQILPLIDEYGKEEDELITLCQKFPEEMKKSVLQSAMQGKLTKQLETDSSVDELLKKIADEKAKLIEEGKIKKDTTKAGASGRALADITEEEIPFDIPENWRWERWGNLSNSIQYGYNASAISSGFAKMVRISDIQDNKILWDSVPYCEISESEYEKYKLNNTDILFARTGGTVGKSVLVSGLTERSVYAGYLIRSHYNHNLNPQYLKYFMECPLYWNQLTQGTTKGCQPNCNGQTLSQMIVPLPPIEEQQRIVEKLNTILPIIDSMAVYGTKKKAGRPKQEEALAFISSLLGTNKSTDSKPVTPENTKLTSKAKEELPAIVKKYADLMGVTYNRITIRHQKTRWGSCTKTGNLSFNCLILKMPETVRDYVIVHELAHRKELNHSTKFWTIVAEYCPWYKDAKQWLKNNGQELMELK